MTTSTRFTLNRRRAAPGLFATALAVASLAAAAPAHGSAPTTTIRQVPIKVTLPACGSFALIFEADVTRRLTTFYDNDGVKVREVLVRSSEGAVSNSETGASVPFTGIWRVTRSYTDGMLDDAAVQTGRTSRSPSHDSA